MLTNVRISQFLLCKKKQFQKEVCEFEKSIETDRLDGPTGVVKDGTGDTEDKTESPNIRRMLD